MEKQKKSLGRKRTKQSLQRKCRSFRGKEKALLDSVKRQQLQLQTGKESDKSDLGNSLQFLQLLLLLLRLIEEIKRLF